MILSKNILESIISSLLSEASERHKQAMKKLPPLDQKISPLVGKFSKNGVVNYAFTMVSVPKVGINPRYKYGNPLGIYFYPLDNQRFSELKNNKLPFVSDLENFGLVRIKNPEKWLNVSDDNMKLNLEKVYEIGKRALGAESDEHFPDFKNFIEKSQKTGWSWKKSKAGKLFDFTYFISQHAVKYKKKSAFVWTTILKEMGYEGIYDPGLSIIHKSEPAQLVAFSKSAVEVIDLFDTAEIRNKDYEKYRLALLDFYALTGESADQYLSSPGKFIKVMKDIDSTPSETLNRLIDKVISGKLSWNRSYKDVLDRNTLFVNEILLKKYPELIDNVSVIRQIHFDVKKPDEPIIAHIFKLVANLENPKEKLRDLTYLIVSTIDTMSCNEEVDPAERDLKVSKIVLGWYKRYSSIGLGDFFLKRCMKNIDGHLPSWLKNKMKGKIDFIRDISHLSKDRDILEYVASNIVNYTLALPDTRDLADEIHNFSAVRGKLIAMKFDEEQLAKISKDIQDSIGSFTSMNSRINTLMRIFENKAVHQSDSIINLVGSLPDFCLDYFADNINSFAYGHKERLFNAIVKKYINSVKSDDHVKYSSNIANKFIGNNALESKYIKQCEDIDHLAYIIAARVSLRYGLYDLSQCIAQRMIELGYDESGIAELEKMSLKKLENSRDKDAPVKIQEFFEEVRSQHIYRTNQHNYYYYNSPSGNISNGITKKKPSKNY